MVTTLMSLPSFQSFDLLRIFRFKWLHAYKAHWQPEHSTPLFATFSEFKSGLSLLK
mgnify:CR=1 FL=1